MWLTAHSDGMSPRSNEVGDGQTPELGSLICVEHKDRVASHVADAVEKGATVLTGGRERPDLGPASCEPTILEGVTTEMLTGACETFGPVVALHLYSSIEEAVRLANGTDYGLNASVWGTDLEAAAAVAGRIEAGNVNDTVAAAYASKRTPSGGLKQSGVGARHGDQGLLEYTGATNLAVLRKQVLNAPRDEPFEKHVEQTLKGLAKTGRRRHSGPLRKRAATVSTVPSSSRRSPVRQGPPHLWRRRA